jgi:uncharacterized protein YtpQ (UPF0354 family)
VCGWFVGIGGEEIGGAAMNWPFGKKKGRTAEVVGVTVAKSSQHSTLDMLIDRNCSRDEFFLLYFKLLQEHMPSASLKMLGDSVIGIVDAAGKESTTYMDNVWLVYSRNEEDRREALERYLRLATSLVEVKAPPKRESIVAVIKDSEYMSMFRPENVAMHEHLCGDIWVVYAEDLPESIGSLSRERMEAAGVAEDELKELSRENLRRILPAAERHGDGPWFLLTAGGDYTASLLAFEGMWEDLAGSVEGDLVAVVPSRDVILYTGSNSSEGIAAIRERAHNIVTTGHHVVSETLIVRTDKRWEVFNAN